MGDKVIADADGVYEGVRAINHDLIMRVSIPAPIAYDILGNLKLAGDGLAEVAAHLGRGLKASLDEYDVYDRSERSPWESAQMAIIALKAAEAHASELGRLLAEAQSAITLQGYNVP